jgi:putative endonuclease
VRLLQARKHTVLARRFRVRHGEIDLITRSGAHLYFVEVKARSVALDQDRFGGGLEAITARKRWRMTKVAQIFIARERLGGLQPHFALVTVVPANQGYRVRFLPDAFDAAA